MSKIKKALDMELRRPPQNFEFIPKLCQVISFDYPYTPQIQKRTPSIYERSNLNPVVLIGGFENEKFIHGTNLRYFQLYPQLIVALEQMLKNEVMVNAYDRSTGEIRDDRVADVTKMFSNVSINNYYIKFKPPKKPPQNMMEYYWRRYDMQVMSNVSLMRINNITNLIKNGGIFK